MKRLVAILLVMTSLSMATLLNTTDSVLRSDAALGGNPAVNVVNMEQGVEVGGTLVNKQNTDRVALGGNKNIDGNMLDDMYLAYNHNLGGSKWIGVAYTVETNTFLSNSTTGVKQYISSYDKGINLTYAQKVEQVKGLAMGVNIESKDMGTKFLNDPSGSNNNTKSDTNYPYTAITIGGIYDISAQGKLTFAHALNPNSLVGTNTTKIDPGASTDTDVAGAIQDVTSLGYIHKVDSKLTVAGTVDLVNQETNEVEVNNVDVELIADSYTQLGVAAEYVLAKDMVAQGYMKVADNVGDSDNSDIGNYTSTLGANVTKALDADSSVIVGLVNYFQKPDDKDAATVSERNNLKLYVNYSKAL